jgi:hypothetical protein
MRTGFALCFLVTSGLAAAQGTPAPAAGAPTAAPATAATAATAAPTTAAPGKAHICLAPSSVQVVGGTSDQAIAAVRQVFTSYLTGPSLEVADLTSRLPSQIREEAKAANCPFVLFTTLKQERKTSGGGAKNFFGHVAGDVAQQGGYAVGGATNNTAGRIAAGATGSAVGNAAYTYGSTTQSNDQLTLTTHLESGDGKALVDMTDKKKADSNGQDLLTPMVEKSATAVAAAVAKPAK